jgi:23S rRNA G2445 N2-methylase RlmL
LRFFATCAAGTEHALEDELRELRIQRLRGDRGGVGFEGGWEPAMRVCLWSRIAVRVLAELAEFRCPDADALYAETSKLDWSEHVRPDRTIAVSAVSRDSALAHTMFIAQRTKDAIVDGLRSRYGARPDVDREDPDLSVFVRIVRDVASVHLDLAGAALHRRGWREPGARAPLKETLAAAILRLSGWDRKRPLLDPMCGSGTIAIEADHWARSIAPGLSRRRFGFERWSSHGPEARELIAQLRIEAGSAAREDGPPVFALDADPEAVAQTRRNAERARAQIQIRRSRLAELRIGALGLTPGRGRPPPQICTNPPYGERIAADFAFWAELEAALERLPQGTRVSLLVMQRPQLRLPKRFERAHLYNGPIECDLVSWDVGRARGSR